MLIPTVFLLYMLMSHNCYLVMIFFIPIICEKFEFTLHAHSWSFTNIIVLCRLGSIHVVFLSYYYREITELKWNIYMIRPFPKRNWHEFQTSYIRPHSGVDSAQWDRGISRHLLFWHFRMCIFNVPPKLYQSNNNVKDIEWNPNTYGIFLPEQHWVASQYIWSLLSLEILGNITISKESVLLSNISWYNNKYRICPH